MRFDASRVLSASAEAKSMPVAVGKRCFQPLAFLYLDLLADGQVSAHLPRVGRVEKVSSLSFDGVSALEMMVVSLSSSLNIRSVSALVVTKFVRFSFVREVHLSRSSY